MHTLMLVEFKLGRGMFMYLYCRWYEVKKKKCEKERLEKERKKRKVLKKKNKKSMNNIVLISEVFWFDNL